MKNEKFSKSCYSLTHEMIGKFNYSAENLLYHFCSILRADMRFMLGFESMDKPERWESLDDAAWL